MLTGIILAYLWFSFFATLLACDHVFLWWWPYDIASILSLRFCMVLEVWHLSSKWCLKFRYKSYPGNTEMHHYRNFFDHILWNNLYNIITKKKIKKICITCQNCCLPISCYLKKLHSNSCFKAWPSDFVWFHESVFSPLAYYRGLKIIFSKAEKVKSLPFFGFVILIFQQKKDFSLSVFFP